MCIYVYMCICVYVYTCICVYMCLRVFVCVYMCTCVYVYTSVDLSLYSDIVSGHIARRSDLKLTDSMFCLCIFSSIFSFDGRM